MNKNDFKRAGSVKLSVRTDSTLEYISQYGTTLSYLFHKQQMFH